MRRSSRRVPPAPPEVSTLRRALAWAFAALFICGLVALLVQHPIAVAVPIAILVLAAWHDARRERRRLREIAEARQGESICGFARSFDTRAIDPLVIRAVYEHLQDLLRGYQPGFPVRASDRLKEDLAVDDEDLDMEIVPEVARRTGRSLDEAQSNPFYGRVKTAADLVYFFNNQRELQSVEWHSPSV